MLSKITITAALAASVAAAPFWGAPAAPLNKRAVMEVDIKSTYNASSSYTSDVTIHESCDAAQTAYLRRGLDDMKLISKHAHDRILQGGDQDPLFVKFFGNSSTGTTSGFYSQMYEGNKAGVIFRCDNPDGNCNQVTAAGPWAGHWRGKNATSETVLCPPTYNATNRYPLSAMCFDGHEIGVAPAAGWLATDFLHRLTHVPLVSGDHVDHWADSWSAVLDLAATNSSLAAQNQYTYAYYALAAWAEDVAHPPMGCIGASAGHADTDSHSAPAASSAASSAVAPAVSSGSSASRLASTAASAGTATLLPAVGAAPGTATATAAESCHTHADGEIHCV